MPSGVLSYSIYWVRCASIAAKIVLTCCPSTISTAEPTNLASCRAGQGLHATFAKRVLERLRSDVSAVTVHVGVRAGMLVLTRTPNFTTPN